jgi:hypothetical protein
MLGLLVIWVALITALVSFAVGRPVAGGALTLAYFLGLSLVHVPGVLPFLDTGSGLDDWDETQLGFEMTILGMAAFVVGAVLARWAHRRRATATGLPPRRPAQVFERLGGRALVFGVVAQFLLGPLSVKIPSLTSISAAWATLLIVGLWLVLYGAAVAADWRRRLATLALLPLLPVVTLVTGGFLGMGIIWDLSVLVFLFVITRQRIWFYVAAPPAVFLGLSLFVTYANQRGEFREFLTQEQPGLPDRIHRASSIITEFELLDLSSPTQARALDLRLNQNALVGAGVMYHEDGRAAFAYGGTIPLWALIPRAVWPDKPDVGGGGTIVTDFAGFQVGEGTSIGPGNVLEFYINFGIPGVLIGFLGLGYLLIRLDQGIMRSLAAEDIRGVLLRAMPGLMLLQPQGNLLEILVGFVAAFVAARLLIWTRLFDVPRVVSPRGWVALGRYGPASRRPRGSGT